MGHRVQQGLRVQLGRMDQRLQRDGKDRRGLKGQQVRRVSRGHRVQQGRMDRKGS